MFLKINTKGKQAKDLGYLLHKHPDKFQTNSLKYGEANMFYSETGEDSCTFVLLLSINPIELSRKRGRNSYQKSFKLADYVNDRPYVASSFLSSAISKTLASALNGNCKDRPELIEKTWDITVEVSLVKSNKGAEEIKAIFEPLGYDVELEGYLLDEDFKNWGASPYFKLTLKTTKTIQDILSHLYVLLPVLDNNKHYYISEEEIIKLKAKGGDWLENHPKRTLIISRYLRYKSSYFKKMEMNFETDDVKDDITNSTKVARPKSVHILRLEQVVQELQSLNCKTIADLGCGEGKLLKLLIQSAHFSKIIGMDVSVSSLEIAKKRLKIHQLSYDQQQRIKLIHGALTYTDKRIQNMDALVLAEVIEHMEFDQLAAAEPIVFDFAKAKNIIVTTPNQEYNVLFEDLPAGKMRHNDHRFEWTRKEFETWGEKIARQYGYAVLFKPVGAVHETYGAITQMAIFAKLKHN